ncbi:MAG TPA: hypothetical protein VF395_06985, partial [Polyangiaceae bacterium]
MSPRLGFLCALAVAAANPACGDPTHDDAVSALGPEQTGVPKGPDHRPGQPCLACHGGDGPARLVMAFGGTVYAHEHAEDPAPNATVRVVGADRRTYETTTNCVGNFWIPAHEFEPLLPAGAAVTSGSTSRVMRTQMHRTGSCNECHSKAEDTTSPGRVWVLPADQEPSF